MARPNWFSLPASRLRVKATFTVTSKILLLDHDPCARAGPRAAFIPGGHTAHPDNASVTFQHRPACALPDRNPLCQEQSLQFLRLPPAPRPIGISRPPVPQDQRGTE